MTAEISLESLRKREEELDFRRDLIEYTPESFTGDQIIDLLHEQRRIYDAMEREVRGGLRHPQPRAPNAPLGIAGWRRWP